MKYSKILLPLAAFAACLLMGNAFGQDYLEGGYVGRPDYSEMAQYFTDPIFYIGAGRQSWEEMYYPYFGAEFFRDYTQPYQFVPVTYAGLGAYPFNQTPYDSDFRLSSIAGMQWEPFKKNWSETLNYTKASSSLRVYQDGAWMTPQKIATPAY